MPQWPLHRQLIGLVHATLRQLEDAGAARRAPELDADQGDFTEWLLAAGWDVTLVSMSTRSRDEAEALYGRNPRLETHLDTELPPR